LTIIVFVVVASMSLAQEVLKPLALSVLLVFILAPLARFLERQGLPRIPAVTCTVLVTVGTLLLVGYLVGNQMVTLANDLPKYQDRIDAKMGELTPSRENALSRASGVIHHVAKLLEGPQARKAVADVKVLADSTYWERLEAAAGSYLRFLGIGSIILILVLFLLLHREDMSDRMVRLFGHRKIGLTTRTMDEAGRRISRYLAVFAAVNSAYGLVVGLGLWAIGVPVPVLWGALAAALRFIPYVGPAAAFLMPLLLSVVVSEGWREPLLVVGLFGILEVVVTSVLEPAIYGKTTGVSAVGLLVAAMFWAWLWGPVGLLLSTPLTVCLAVAGRYVPGLSIFSTLLGEEPALEDPLRLYQRLLAVDRDGARAVLNAAMKKGLPEVAFDEVLIPVLAKAELDLARKEINAEDRDLVWRAVDDFLDELECNASLSPRLVSPGTGEVANSPSQGGILALGLVDTADVLVLRMLNLLLDSWGYGLEIVPGSGSPQEFTDFAAGRSPAMVILSHLPPVGLTATRHVAKRLRQRLPEVPVVVGIWGDGPGADARRVSGDGPVNVVGAVAEARDHVLTTGVPAAELARLLERALLEADGARAGHLFERVLRDWPIDRVCMELIHPTLASVSAGRASGGLTRDQEESVGRFFRERLLPEVDALRRPGPNARRALFACPGDDVQDVRSMMLTLLLRARGWDVLDLGVNVPAGRIPEAVAAFRPHLAVFSASRAESAGELVSAASAILENESQPPVITFGGEAFSGVPPANDVPGPVLPEDIEAKMETIDRLVAELPAAC
jgi:predicted PurR-regulated permease PerM